MSYVVHVHGVPTDLKSSWATALNQTTGVPNTYVKKFKTNSEANEYIKSFSSVSTAVTALASEDVYTDASLKEGIGARAGFFSENDSRNFVNIDRGSNSVPVLEVQAIIDAAKLAKAGAVIFTDSSYAVDACKSPFHYKWQNAQILSEMKRVLLEKNIKLAKIQAHSGIIGNEIADQMCRDAILKIKLK